MPKVYKRKTNKRRWTVDQLEAAIAEIGRGHPIRSTARVYDIPESTLRDKLKEGASLFPNFGRKPTFPPAVEKQLANHIIKLSNMFYGITPTTLREVVFKYASQNNITHRFNEDKKAAGKDWFQLFIKRNPVISLRKPEGTSVSRIVAFNEEEVQRYFKNLGDVLEKYRFSENNIYNVDETGISTVQKPTKILSPKGQKQVGSVISWERGKNVTIVCAFSASGTYISPMFIFPRQRHSPQLEKGGPAGAIYSCSKNGWINGDLFLDWIKHFQQRIKSSKEDPVLLVLDNHVSHISLNVYNYCKDHGIVMVSIPPHTSHKLQPLDLTFYGPLKLAYNKQCDMYLRSNVHKKITHYELAELFNMAYIQTATIEKAVSGFKTAGICPYNPDKFSKEDFAPAQHFRPIEDAENVQPNQDPIIQQHISGKDIAHGSAAITNPFSFSSHSQPQPSCSKTLVPPNSFENQSQKIPDKMITFEALSTIPQPATSKASKSTRKKHSEIITSSPMKTVLEENERKKKIFADKKAERLQKGKVKKSKNTSAGMHVVRKLIDSGDSSSENEVDQNLLCDDDELDDIDPLNPKDICSICGEFGRDNELWYRCVKCSEWTHAECSGRNSPTNYICDFCV